MTNNKDLAKSLKQLKNLSAAGAPCQDFVSRNKDILMMQIRNSSAEKKQILNIRTLWQIAEAVVPENLFKFAVKPALLALLVFGTAFGGWAATVSASYGSLPGDTLYSLKIAAEKAQLTLTSKEAKPSLQVEFAGRRLEEMAKIASQPSSDNQQERTKQAVKNFTKQVQAVKTTLENLETKDNPAKALEIAQIVDRKTTEYTSVLEQTKDAVSEEVKKDVDTASNMVNDTGIKAVEVIVKTSNNDSSTQQEVTTKVEEKIKMVEEAVSLMSSTSTIGGTITQEAKDGLIEAKQALTD